jgi:diguanylate cyclase (GGDEF)-like protein
VPTPKGDASVTISIGIAETILKPQDESVDKVIRRADEAMYAAKQAGRNRTIIFDPK